MEMNMRALVIKWHYKNIFFSHSNLMSGKNSHFIIKISLTCEQLFFQSFTIFITFFLLLSKISPRHIGRHKLWANFIVAPFSVLPK